MLQVKRPSIELGATSPSPIVQQSGADCNTHSTDIAVSLLETSITSTEEPQLSPSITEYSDHSLLSDRAAFLRYADEAWKERNELINRQMQTEWGSDEYEVLKEQINALGDDADLYEWMAGLLYDLAQRPADDLCLTLACEQIAAQEEAEELSRLQYAAN